MSKFAIELNNVHIQNIVTHKDTTFTFKPGISVIRGDNGSGKSLCFSTLANLLYGAPPLNNRKNTAKLMHRQNGRIELNLKSNKKSYKLCQFKKGNSVGYDVELNGKSLKTHTISAALDQISTIFPLTQNQFYTTLYLNAYRSSAHVLLYGTGPQRKEFFENFFNLQHYDVIYSLLRQQYSEYKLDVAKIDEKEDEIKRLKNDLKKVDERVVKKLENKLNKISVKYDEYSELIIKIQTYENMKQKIVNKGLSLKQLVSEYKELKRKIKQYQKLIEKDNKAEENNKYYEQVKQRRTLLQQKIQQIKLNDLDKDKLEKYVNRLDDVKSEIEKQEELKHKYNHYLTLQQVVPDKFKESKDTALDLIEKIKVKLGNARAIVRKLGKLQDISECPTCGTRLNKKEISYLFNQAYKDINKFRKYENIFDEIKAYHTYENFNFDEGRLKELEVKRSKLEKQIKQCKENIQRIEEKHHLEEQLKSLPDVEYIERIDIKDIKETNKKANKKLLELKEDIVCVRYLRDMDIDQHLKNKKHIQKYLSDNKDRVRSLGEKVGKYKAYLISNKTNKKRIKSLEKEISSLQETKNKLKIYEVLINAYGPKGIKISQINNLAELFCNQLNIYAGCLFPENIKFSAIVDENNFNILAERDNGIGDVNTLSGAQSRCFQLLCALVLLSFIPKKYKADTLILDEMESGLKKDWRDKFANEFLPQMLSIVPKIVVITPMTSKELYITNAKEYTVIKENNVSKIKEGNYESK